MIAQGLRRWLLLILIATLVASQAGPARFNLHDNPLPPKGALGVRLDHPRALKSGKGGPLQVIPEKAGDTVDQRIVVYSSVLTFRSDVSAITDGQLVKIAGDAWREIFDEKDQYGLVKVANYLPFVMTALAVGENIFLSSSQKGGISFMEEANEDNPARLQLLACNIRNRSDHANGAGCGEIMTAFQFYQRYPDLRLTELSARIVSVQGNKVTRETIIKPACSSPDKNGCHQYVEQENIREIAENTAPETYVLGTIAGGLLSRGQEQLGCGSINTD